MNNEGSLPLTGVRVVDFSRVLAGPLCGMVLGDFGADVVKIEHPERGDDTRDWGVRIGKTETAYFNSMNRNKRSVALDLQTDVGRTHAHMLAKKSDVLIQNFKFGGMEKLGLGYEALRDVNPRLIYCSISGYGRGGSEASRPGYDLVVQGEAGLMAMNGEAQQPPLKFGVAVVDLMTGMCAAQAVLAALYEREKTGVGRHVQMALFDCGVMITSYYGLEALQLGEDPPRYGNAHPSIVPYGVFDASDGPLVITVGNNAQFQRFCRDVIQRPDLAEIENFRTNIGRSLNRTALLPEIRAALLSFPRDWLLKELSAAGIPSGKVMGLHDALTSDRVREAKLVTDQPHPDIGTSYVLAPPYCLDGQRLPIRHAPPQLGASTDEIFSEWGIAAHAK